MAIGNSGCTPWNPVMISAYGYKPDLAPGVVYLALFGLSMFGHIFQAFWYRSWWTLVFALGALVEIIGWAARTWSSQCPYNADAFLMQTTTLILAPTFFTAGAYIILGCIISIIGHETSPLSPLMYLWIFCTIDLISLIIQAVGGGMAAVAFNMTPVGDTDVGTNIMIAGVDFQLVSVLVFSVLFAYVMFRATVVLRLQMFKTDRNMQLLVLATAFSILLVVMRSIYRTVELAGGWTGPVIQTQRYFVALDGAPMAAAVIVFNIFHPGDLINKLFKSRDEIDEKEDRMETPETLS